MRFPFIALTLISLFPIGRPALGCTCAPPPPGMNTPEELSKWNAQGTAAVFEGKVESAELKWKLVEAPVGSVVPADMDQDPPEMEVHLQVLRAYEGANEKRVRVRTGLGGGDCGFDFQTGKEYLVYAYKDTAGELSTGICSSTALLKDSNANLRELRGGAGPAESAGDALATQRGGLCGNLILDDPNQASQGQILLFKAGNSSPIPSEETEPGADGSFCANDLRPGSYLLLFKDSADESPNLFGFFPGVVKPSEATELEVKAGETVSHLLFKVPNPQKYSVRGKITAFDEFKRQAAPKVVLMSPHKRLLVMGYSAEVSSDGTFAVSHVLPGTYWAVVTVEADSTAKWSTRKVEVSVGGDVSGLALELFQ